MPSLCPDGYQPRLRQAGPGRVVMYTLQGIGVMKSVKQKRLAKAVLKNATTNNAGQYGSDQRKYKLHLNSAGYFSDVRCSTQNDLLA